MKDTKLRARFRDLQKRYHERMDAWANAVGRQELNKANQHKVSAYRLIRKAYAAEEKAHARAELWAGGSYED